MRADRSGLLRNGDERADADGIDDVSKRLDTVCIYLNLNASPLLNVWRIGYMGDCLRVCAIDNHLARAEVLLVVENEAVLFLSVGSGDLFHAGMVNSQDDFLTRLESPRSEVISALRLAPMSEIRHFGISLL